MAKILFHTLCQNEHEPLHRILHIYNIQHAQIAVKSRDLIPLIDRENGYSQNDAYLHILILCIYAHILYTHKFTYPLHISILLLYHVRMCVCARALFA